MTSTWKPIAAAEHGRLDGAYLDELPDTAFAFPRQRKEPLTDASHVRNAVARFNQVEGVSDADRAHAWENIQAAAAYFGVQLSETGWQDFQPFP